MGHELVVQHLIKCGADINAVNIVSCIFCFYRHNDNVYYLATGNSFTLCCS